jgi:hypothetical protein
MREITLWKPTHPAPYASKDLFTNPVSAIFSSNGVSGLVKLRVNGDDHIMIPCADKCGFFTQPSIIAQTSEVYTIYNPLWGIKEWAIKECFPHFREMAKSLDTELHDALIDYDNGNFYEKAEDNLKERGASAFHKLQREFYFGLRDTERFPLLRPVTIVIICRCASVRVSEGRLRFNPDACLDLADKLGDCFDKEVGGVEW